MNRTAGRIIIAIILIASVYTIVRYHIFKGIGWEHFALLIMNKIMAFSGFILLVLSVGLDPVYRKKGKEWLIIRKFLGRTGMMLIVIHIIMSFLLFRPEVYDKFFNPEGTLNAMGEWSMLLGTLGITAYIIMHNSFSNFEEGNGFQNWIRSPIFGILALLISSLHIAIIGFNGWLTPREWHGGMPSISLVSVAIFVIVLILFISDQLRNRKTKSQEH
jgi:DMSO/TMAO reductase YedYZ heme-binding membrane subunit